MRQGQTSCLVLKILGRHSPRLQTNARLALAEGPNKFAKFSQNYLGLSKIYRLFGRRPEWKIPEITRSTENMIPSTILRCWGPIFQKDQPRYSYRLKFVGLMLNHNSRQIQVFGPYWLQKPDVLAILGIFQHPIWGVCVCARNRFYICDTLNCSIDISG